MGEPERIPIPPLGPVRFDPADGSVVPPPSLSVVRPAFAGLKSEPFGARVVPPKIASIIAPRPDQKQQWKGVINPQGRIEPQWIGQHFFDAQNKAFYRADGPTAFDWGLVTPREFQGSFVKSFVDFLPPANHGMSKEDLAEACAPAMPHPDRAPHLLEARVIAEGGLRVNDHRVWTAGDVRALSVRITLEAPPPVCLFVGFASEPVHPTMPIAVADPDIPGLRIYDKGAVGVAFDDNAGESAHGLALGTARGQVDRIFRFTHVAVRVELAASRFSVFLDDALLFAEQYVAGFNPDALGPRVSFFRYGRVE